MVHFGDLFMVTLVRTVRVPDDGRVYPQTPHLGEFEVRRARDYASRAPAAWAAQDALFVPIYAGDALWIRFEARMPHAVQIAIGQRNAVSGAPWDGALHERPQNYLVCPPQQWIDGVRDANGRVRQFTAHEVSEASTEPGADRGALRLHVYPPKAGSPAARPLADPDAIQSAPSFGFGAGSGFGSGAGFGQAAPPGGLIQESIEPDPFGMNVWNVAAALTREVHFVDVSWFCDVTGEPAPPPPPDPLIYK